MTGSAIATDGIRKVVFASDQLPAHLDDRERRSLWHDTFTSSYSSLDLSYLADRPFSARFEFAQVGIVKIAQFQGTMNRLARTKRTLSVDPNDDFCIGLNRARSRISTLQLGREAVLDRGAAVLLANGEVGSVRFDGDNAWFLVGVPRRPVLELVRDAEDLLARPLQPSNAALRHLQRYLGILLQPGGIEDDPPLLEHVATTLSDLVALALGTGRDAAEVARLRGLRSARLREILAEIRTNFAKPAFSADHVALKVGVSPGYVKNLLWESGSSFTDRVLELRLQKARAMLADHRCNELKVSEIAYDCGFNEVPYFNRCFRRRFGASPTDFRK
jgi:AraC-like DNA-binding protein